MKKVRIGSGAGYAGDRVDPAVELLKKGDLDYIIFECLAERTIGLARQEMLADPTKGYSRQLEYRLSQVLGPAKEHGVKIISNMGAGNPHAAVAKAIEIAKQQGKYRSRKPLSPPGFQEMVIRWKRGEITAAEACRRLGISKATFYRKVK